MSSNIEYTGDRDLTLSLAFRETVEGSAAIDQDMMERCRSCQSFTGFWEATSTGYYEHPDPLRSQKFIMITQQLAADYNVPALFLVHAKQDYKFQYPIFLGAWNNQGAMMPFSLTTWDKFQSARRRLLQLHKETLLPDGRNLCEVRTKERAEWDRLNRMKRTVVLKKPQYEDAISRASVELQLELEEARNAVKNRRR